MKAIKVTSALWLGTLGPRIAEFVKKTNLDGIVYEGFYAYLAQTIQHGGKMAEFWVVFKKNEPVAMAHWFVRPLPYIGTMFCDMIYSWTDDEATSLLADKGIEFSRRTRSPILSAYAMNKKVFDRLKEVFNAKGVEFKRSSQIITTGREVQKGEE